MAKKRISKPKKDYAITLQLGDLLLEGTGSTMLEALKSVPVPAKIVTKGILVVSHGQSYRQRILLVPQVRRLFYPIAQQVLAKQLAFGLK